MIRAKYGNILPPFIQLAIHEERRMWEEVRNLWGISTDPLYIIVDVLESGAPTIYVQGYGPMVGVLP